MSKKQPDDSDNNLPVTLPPNLPEITDEQQQLVKAVLDKNSKPIGDLVGDVVQGVLSGKVKGLGGIFKAVSEGFAEIEKKNNELAAAETKKLTDGNSGT